MPIIIISVERGMFKSSSLVFLCINIKGKISNVVNSSRYNDIESGETVSLTDFINMAANETETIEMKSAIYGLFFIMIVVVICATTLWLSNIFVENYSIVISNINASIRS